MVLQSLSANLSCGFKDLLSQIPCRKSAKGIYHGNTRSRAQRSEVTCLVLQVSPDSYDSDLSLRQANVL